MTLVVHTTSVDGLRRSTRIRGRRQTTVNPSSYFLTHPQPAVSPGSLSRISHRVPNLPTSSTTAVIVATLKPPSHPKSTSTPHSPSTPTPRKCDPSHVHSTSSSRTPASSSRSKTVSVAKKTRITLIVPQHSSPTPLLVLAGTKRKHSQIASDRDHRPQYQLVSLPAGTDEQAQTPRQLRYAKRQRLLTSLSHNHSPPAPLAAEKHELRSDSSVNDPPQQENSISLNRSQEPRAERSARRDRAPHRASTDGRLLAVNTPAPTPPVSSFAQTKSPRPSDSPDTPLPDVRVWPELPPSPRPGSPPTLEVPTLAPSYPEPPVETRMDEDEHEFSGPTFTILHRRPVPVRERRPDITDTSIWKLACQERVEYLKEVYREVFDAVVRAEALTTEGQHCQACNSAPSVPQAQTEFNLYTPSTSAAEPTADADADGVVDMDAGYSSDWDSDEDEDEDEDEDMQDAADENSPTYDALVTLDGTASQAAPSPWGHHQVQQRLPPLSSVRVYALEEVSELSARDGMPFMGRGTPVDRQRRADWAAPALPALPIRGWESYGDPSEGMGVGMLHWLDPALRAQSASPDPPLVMSPAPSSPTSLFSETYFAESDCGSCGPVGPSMTATDVVTTTAAAAAAVTIGLEQDFRACTDFASSIPTATSASASTSDVILAPAPVSVSPSAACTLDPNVTATVTTTANANSNPTGCPFHASFLQCLQSPGCGPCYGSATAAVVTSGVPPNSNPNSNPFQDSTLDFFAFVPGSSSTMMGANAGVGTAMSVGVGMGAGVLGLNQELARFMRSHLVPGSVTLSHALG